MYVQYFILPKSQSNSYCFVRSLSTSWRLLLELWLGSVLKQQSCYIRSPLVANGRNPSNYLMDKQTNKNDGRRYLIAHITKSLEEGWMQGVIKHLFHFLSYTFLYVNFIHHRLPPSGGKDVWSYQTPPTLDIIKLYRNPKVVLSDPLCHFLSPYPAWFGFITYPFHYHRPCLHFDFSSSVMLSM